MVVCGGFECVLMVVPPEFAAPDPNVYSEDSRKDGDKTESSEESKKTEKPIPKIDFGTKTEDKSDHSLKGGDEAEIDQAVRNHETMTKRRAQRKRQSRRERRGVEMDGADNPFWEEMDPKFSAPDGEVV